MTQDDNKNISRKEHETSCNLPDTDNKYDCIDFYTESKLLKNAWMRHKEEFLDSYLRQSIQDPRFNPQSILTRYAILEYLIDEDISKMKYHELLFSAVMLWFCSYSDIISDPYERSGLTVALKNGADATETLEIPRILKMAFNLTFDFNGEKIKPMYVEKVIAVTPDELDEIKKDNVSVYDRRKKWSIDEDALNVFVNIWRRFLPLLKIRTASVLEPACGSANDYSVLHEMGLTGYIDYRGFDICEKNVKNARRKYQEANITFGNILTDDLCKTYDVIFVHDLFEHLSREALEVALKKLCRHCDGVLCLNFFNMEEIPDHIIRPIPHLYHLNTLSRRRICEIVESSGFNIQTVNVLSFFKEVYGLEPWIIDDDYYNSRACTLICKKINK